MSNLVVIDSTPAMITADQLYRAACGVYAIVLDDVNAGLRSGEINPYNARQAVARVEEARQAAFNALVKMIEGRPDETAVKGYVSAALSFVRAWATCLNHKVDPLAPAHRREMKSRFDFWKATEQDYARAGYRTISFEDWLSPLVGYEQLQPSPLHLLLVKRDKDEPAVHHAIALAKKHGSKLKI